jgi:hypothetical protein
MNTTIVVAITVAALAGLVSLALTLWFLWRVYEQGGRRDLAAAAKALRRVYDPSWASSLVKFISAGRVNSNTQINGSAPPVGVRDILDV